MRTLARATLTLALLLVPLAACAQVQQGPGVTSLNGRRGALTLQSTDLPSPTVYLFTGDGSTTVFSWSTAADPTRVAVTVGGVNQGSGSFSAIATSITLAAPAPAGSPVSVVLGAIPVTVPAIQTGAPTIFSFSGDGVTASFVLPSTPPSLTRYGVTVGGIAQSRSACALSATALTCAGPPPMSADIEVIDGP